MPSRRLDDRIRQICSKLAVVGRDPDYKDSEIELLLSELRAAIHQKVQRVRIIAANKLLHGKDAANHERRMNP